MEDDGEEVFAALRKRALGYDASETISEYDAEGNETRRKVSTKHVPPDLGAIKLLLELRGGRTPSEEELEEEKRRVLDLLKRLYADDGGKDGTR